MNAEEKSRPLTRPLNEELIAQSRLYDVSWKLRSDRVYLIRDNRWYRDDYLEVPTSLLRHWMAANLPFAPNTGRIPVPATPGERLKQWTDRYAEFAGTLTPWQIANGLRSAVPEETMPLSPAMKLAMDWGGPAGHFSGREFPFWVDSIYVLQNYQSVLFYAGLNAEMRQAALENRLAFYDLADIQRQQAIQLVPQLVFLVNRPLHQPIRLGMQPNIYGKLPELGPLVGRLFLVPPQPPSNPVFSQE